MNYLNSLLFFIFLTTKIFSQNFIVYNQQIVKANLSVVDGEYNAAIQHFCVAFESVGEKAKRHDLYNMAKCAAILNKEQLAKEYLLRSRQKIAVNDSNVFHFCKIVRDSKKVNSTINVRFVELLDSLNQEDQFYRQKIRIRENWCFGIGKRKFQRLIKEKDSLISYTLDSLIRIYGFPSTEKIGKQSFLNVCVMHKAQFEQCFRDGIVYDALANGEISPYTFAAFYWFELPNGKHTWLSSLNRGLTLNEKNTIDDMRYNFGLPSIEEELVFKEFKKNRNKNMYYFSFNWIW
jgi:hypothetical protein